MEGLSKGREVGEFCVDSRTRGHPVWLEHKGQREKFWKAGVTLWEVLITKGDKEEEYDHDISR